MGKLLDALLDKDRELAHDFKTATLHQIAAILLGQLERVIFLLNRNHANMDPIASSLVYVANVAQTIYTPRARVAITVTSLSTNAANASTVTVQSLTDTSPFPVSLFVASFPAGGGNPITPFQEFILPLTGQLQIVSNQPGTVNFSASVVALEQVSLIENYRV